MKRACAGAFAGAFAFALLTTTAARAEEISFDFRSPVRAGFAYTALSRAPAFDLSWSLELDLARLSRRLAVTGVLDFDSHVRPDLPDKDPRSSFAMIGGGFGFFYVSDGAVGVGFAATLGPSFDSQDITGFAFETRAYLIPYYVSFNDAVQRGGDHFGAWVRSSLSFWVSARLDFTNDANGSTLAFGGAIDVMRIFFMPYVTALTKALR
ncbi:MAG TPA: hypothetical protein VH054_28180 [Polyangiaceae bacterium]|jgi:hypothetical protein|nr:hypothetical protein [Polyangiaceae bacterium]